MNNPSTMQQLHSLRRPRPGQNDMSAILGPATCENQTRDVNRWGLAL